jgi:hypothetical protein
VTSWPGAAELLRRSEPGRPGAHDGDALPGANGRRLRRDPALREGAVDDRELDRLDRHRVVVDPEDARALARGGAERPRELRKLFVAWRRSIASRQSFR